MTAQEIAQIVAEYLNNRDDIATATPTTYDPTSVTVVTQGGGQFRIHVQAQTAEPSDA